MYLPELQIHQNRSALFATRCRSPDEEVETRIRVRKDKLVEALNNENVHISKITVELEPGRKILNSDKLPISRTRVGLSSYETKKLLSEIDSTIAKSKDQENQTNIEKLKYYESDEFQKLIEPEYNYETCVEPSYCAVPYHISVRSTKPPKISVQLQEPEQTRKGRSYRTIRRQPDVEVVRETKPQWKHGFHGQELKYSKHLENKHPQINRYFKVADSSRALQSLDLKYPLTVDATMDEYRKELRRQSELIRGSEIKNPKWWEDTSSKFHYNYHKNKIMELSADLDRADYHRDMFDAYCAKIEKRSKQFWSDQK